MKERSGIEAQDRLDGRVAGDTQLTGATLGSKSRQGDLATEGKTKAVALEDYREKDGGSGSANVGFGRSGLPSATVEGSRVEQWSQKSTQASGVLLEGYRSEGGVEGALKSKAEDLTKETKNEHVASTDMVFTISDPRTGKSAGKGGRAGADAPDAPQGPASRVRPSPKRDGAGDGGSGSSAESIYSTIADVSPGSSRTTAPDRRASAADRQPCLLYTSPSPRDRQKSRMPSSA